MWKVDKNWQKVDKNESWRTEFGVSTFKVDKSWQINWQNQRLTDKFSRVNFKSWQLSVNFKVDGKKLTVNFPKKKLTEKSWRSTFRQTPSAVALRFLDAKSAAKQRLEQEVQRHLKRIDTRRCDRKQRREATECEWKLDENFALPYAEKERLCTKAYHARTFRHEELGPPQKRRWGGRQLELPPCCPEFERVQFVTISYARNILPRKKYKLCLCTVPGYWKVVLERN